MPRVKEFIMIRLKKLLRTISIAALVTLSVIALSSPQPGEAAARKTVKAAKKKTAAKPSGAPTAAIVAQKMRALWVRPAAAGYDGATTVVIHSVVIGRPRPWSILDGGGGNRGTKVWPAKVHWTLRTHYRTRTEVRERHWNVSCFKNGFNEWVVQQNGDGVKEKKTEEPSTMQ